MRSAFLAMLAEFLQFQAHLDLLILCGMVVHPFTVGAFQFDEIILRHTIS